MSKKNYTVSVVKCETYDFSKVQEAVKKSVELLGGISKFVKKGDKVLIKPNLLQPAHPDKAITTHPEVVRAVIRLVKKQGAIPIVGDSPGIGDIEKIADVAGILDVCREEKIKLIPLKPSGVKKIISGKVCKEFTVAKELDEVNCIINIPRLKTHVLTTYTGAVKNLFGLIPGGEKKTFHINFSQGEDFSEMLLDLYLLIKPKLTIMDAVVGMEGQGPSGGNPRKIGYILAGNDALALDTVAISIANLFPVPLLEKAHQRGLAQADMKNITLVGDVYTPLYKFKKPFFLPQKLPKFLLYIARYLVTSKPIILKEKCIKCHKCVKVCPKKTIHIEEKYPVIKYRNCIRCYCCHEHCPVRAIILKKGFLLRFFRERFV